MIGRRFAKPAEPVGLSLARPLLYPSGMKKMNQLAKRMQLVKTTIRELNADQLDGVRGGGLASAIFNCGSYTPLSNVSTQPPPPPPPPGYTTTNTTTGA